MKKLVWLFIVLGLGVIFFAPIFKRSEPVCICYSTGPCPACNNESLWEKIKGNSGASVEQKVEQKSTATIELTVLDFYRLLSEKKYAEASMLYDGSYDGLRGWNPDIPRNDFFDLWKNACEHNGLNCFAAKIVSKSEIPVSAVFRPDDMLKDWRDKGAEYTHTYKFIVQFVRPDGSIFAIGPCCGEIDNGERTREFTEYAGEKNGKYYVLTPPPYTP